jgi:dihydroorotate dehydrogenase
VCGLANLLFGYNRKDLSTTVFGVDFKNPVGLAAGFDKDAELIDEFAAYGFGFIEIGTLTPKPQPGNPKPRLFRLPVDAALINRMGFNNQGVEDAVKRLRKVKSRVIIGGNIGKNKVTPNEDAARDYEICFETLYDHVDYFAVNVSSPNTPDLRALQEKEPLRNLLSRLQSRNNQKKTRKPILLKIAPDLNWKQLDDILEIIQELKIDGIIATNTTIERSNLKSKAALTHRIGNGGLSGKPLKDRSVEIIKYIRQKSEGLPIIGVGGVHTPEDALEKIKAGASLIQLYTGFIYEGPALVKKIKKSIIKSGIYK